MYHKKLHCLARVYCLRYVLMFSKNENILFFICFWILVFSGNIRCCPHRKYFRFWLRSNSDAQTNYGFWLGDPDVLSSRERICRYERLALRCVAKIPRNRMEPGVDPNCIAADWRYLGSRNYFLRSQSDPFPRKNAISIGSADFRHRTPPCAPPPWPLKSLGLNPVDWTLAIWHTWVCTADRVFGRINHSMNFMLLLYKSYNITLN